MTEPEQDDLSAEADNLVQRTDNGAGPDDPVEQPPQEPRLLTRDELIAGAVDPATTTDKLE